MPNACNDEGRAVDGMRAALPFVVPTFALAVSFGALARSLGWGTVAPIVMSLVVFSGSAQFAVAGVLAAGGSVGAAVLAAALVNARFLPMGLAVAPGLRGGAVRRAVEAQALIDTSWALAQRPGGRVERLVLLGATVPSFLAWQAGTVVGVLGGSALGDVEALGLDVLFPMFFVALLLPELRTRRGVAAAALAGVVTVALVPFTPPGVPVVAASLVALLGLRGPR
jgi:4-azaleucine resistance transporter AzlC